MADTLSTFVPPKVQDVARALAGMHAVRNSPLIDEEAVRIISDLTWRAYVEDAKAAISAMLVPTKDMTLAAERMGDSEGYGNISEFDAESVWEDMILAALGQQEP